MAKYKISALKTQANQIRYKLRRITTDQFFIYRVGFFNRWDTPDGCYNDGTLISNIAKNYKRYFVRLKAEDYSKEILQFFKYEISSKNIERQYQHITLKDISLILSNQTKKRGNIDIGIIVNMNIPLPFANIDENYYENVDNEEIKQYINTRKAEEINLNKTREEINTVNQILIETSQEILSWENKISNYSNRNKKHDRSVNNGFISILLGKTKEYKLDNMNYLTGKLNKAKNKFETVTQKKLQLEKEQLSLEDKIIDINKKIRSSSQHSSVIKSFLIEEFNIFDKKQRDKYETFISLKEEYENDRNVASYLKFLLGDSWYSFEFKRNIKIEFNAETKEMILDYLLPSKEDIPNETINKKGDEWVSLSDTKFRKVYEDIIYSIVIRTLSEIFFYDGKKYIDSVCFNGKSIERSPSTGQFEEKYILSINVLRNQIENLDLDYIQPKECFKHLKGVSVSKLYELTEIKPIITPKFADKRFIESKEIEVANSPNLAEMDWEDFEHLVRQIFEWEFSDKGGEVRVTQSSRDGGVDAIVNDPDPIRGGKIIIQAKRYTNTVGVSAVRDLYGTIINEGANKGILITTSDYGPDSYKFAQGKPITLLNGGHLLYLLEKHGKKAHINIEAAKKNRKELS